MTNIDKKVSDNSVSNNDRYLPAMWQPGKKLYWSSVAKCFICDLEEYYFESAKKMQCWDTWNLSP